MKAYTYPTGEPLNEYGLLELNEVSLNVHIRDESDAWKEEWPDIVVCKPNE